MNKVILMGRLTADPELRQTPQGTAVTRFTVAVNRRYSKDSQQQADFITCVAWRQTAEFICRFFSKGRMIAVEGSLQVRTWDDRDGKRQYSTEVIVDNAEFTGSKNETGASSNGSYQQNFGGGFQEPQTNNSSSFESSAPSQSSANDGFMDLEFSDDAGSEDDLPF